MLFALILALMLITFNHVGSSCTYAINYACVIRNFMPHRVIYERGIHWPYVGQYEQSTQFT